MYQQGVFLFQCYHGVVSQPSSQSYIFFFFFCFCWWQSYPAHLYPEGQSGPRGPPEAFWPNCPGGVLPQLSAAWQVHAAVSATTLLPVTPHPACPPECCYSGCTSSRVCHVSRSRKYSYRSVCTGGKCCTNCAQCCFLNFSSSLTTVLSLTLATLCLVNLFWASPQHLMRNSLNSVLCLLLCLPVSSPTCPLGDTLMAAPLPRGLPRQVAGADSCLSFPQKAAA